MTTTFPAPSAPPPPPPPARQLWPAPTAPVRTATLALAAAAGGVAGFALPDQPPGAGLLVVGVLTAAAAAWQRSRTWTGPELALAATGGLLLAAPAVRDAGWLVALCLLGAGGLGLLAVSGARSWTALALAPLAGVAAGLRALPWVARGVTEAPGGVRRGLAVARTGLVTALVLVVFGALLASADAAFARLVDVLVPDLQLGELPARLVLAALVGAVVLAAACLALAPPPWDRVPLPTGRAVRPVEWLVPVAALDLLLVAFLVVQSTVLFGGRDHVRGTDGLTVAEYARSGFWQLLVVTALVLVVVAAAVRWAPRERPRDGLVVRAALGLLLALTLAVAGSALLRLHLYEQAFGATRLRLLAAAIALWLGVVLLVVAWAGRRWPHGTPSRTGLPRAVAVSAALALLGLAAVDADALIAQRNVDRFLAGAESDLGSGAGPGVDVGYLSHLSADAVPALLRLPEPYRSCSLWRIARRLDESEGGWAGANAARSRARELLAERPLQPRSDAQCGHLRPSR